MITTEWRAIEEFPSYLVNPDGLVRHHDRIEPRRTTTNSQGFPIITLYAEDSKTRYLRQVNKLVADAYLRPKELYLRLPEEYRMPDEKMNMDNAHLLPLSKANSIWHLDGDLQNCSVENLRWDLRGHVLEWNDMHRRNEPRWASGKVRAVVDGQLGPIHESAYHAALAQGTLESKALWWCEMYAEHGDRVKAQFVYAD